MLAFNLLSAQEYCNFQEWTSTKGILDRTTDNIEPTIDILENDLFEVNTHAIDDLDNIYLSMPVFDETSETYKLFIRRINASGQEAWSDIYEIPEAAGDVIPTIPKIDDDGNIIIAGAFVVTAPLDLDGFALKLSPTGNVIWQNTYSNAANGFDGWLTATTDNVGNIYLGGATTPQGLMPDFTVQALNTDGQELWLRQIDQLGQIDAATNIEYLNGVIFATGVTQQNTETYGILNIGFTATNGTLLYETPVFANNNEVYRVTSLITDNDNEIVQIAGTIITDEGADFYVAKVNSLTGLIIWQSQNPSQGLGDARARAAAVDTDGNIFVAGYMDYQNTHRDFAMVKYNALGFKLWTKFYDGNGLNDEAYDIALDNDNNIYLTGYGIEQPENKDFLTIKTNNNGTEIWRKFYNGIHNGEDIAETIQLDNTGGVIVGGPTDEGELVRHTMVKYGDKCTVEVPATIESVTASGSFMENRGQLLNTNNSTITEIKYYTEGVATGNYFNKDGLSYVLSNSNGQFRIDMDYLSSNDRHRNIYPLNKRTDYYNFLLGQLGEPREKVPLHNNLVHYDAFPNIDIQYGVSGAGLSYFFVCKPQSAPTEMRLKFSGQTGLSINSLGELVISSPLGNHIIPKPIAYELDEQNNISTVSWQPSFMITGNIVTFNLGAYDSSKNLVLEMMFTDCGDPENQDDNLKWCTFYEEEGHTPNGFYHDVVNDGENIFVCGESDNRMFPTNSGTTLPPDGDLNAFLIKFDSEGIRLWSNVIASEDNEFGFTVAVDDLGNSYLGGATTSNNFPVPQSVAPIWSNTSLQGAQDGFIIKFASVGSVQFFALIGEVDGIQSINKIHKADNGDFIVGGSGKILAANSDSSPFAESSGGAFVARFSSDFLTHQWTSQYGPTNNSDFAQINDIDTDADGNIFISGQTSFGGVQQVSTTDGSLPFSGGGFDAFMAKISFSPHNLLWSSNYVGTGDDFGEGIELDSDGNLFVAGWTNSPTIGGFNTSPNTLGGNSDYFIMKFSNNMGIPLIASMSGNSGNDAFFDVEIDNNDKIYFIGETSGSNFSATSFGNYFLQPSSGSSDVNTDILIERRNNSLTTTEWLTYMGDEPTESGSALTIIEGENQLFFTGLTGYTDLADVDFPLRPNIIGESYYECRAGFVEMDNNGIIGKFDLDFVSNVNEKKDDDTSIGMLISPNPNEGIFTLNLQDSETTSGKVTIFNSIGHSCYEIKIKDNSTKVNISHLPKGIYFVQYRNAQIKIVEKIVLQ